MPTFLWRGSLKYTMLAWCRNCSTAWSHSGYWKLACVASMVFMHLVCDKSLVLSILFSQECQIKTYSTSSEPHRFQRHSHPDSQSFMESCAVVQTIASRRWLLSMQTVHQEIGMWTGGLVGHAYVGRDLYTKLVVRCKSWDRSHWTRNVLTNFLTRFCQGARETADAPSRLRFVCVCVRDCLGVSFFWRSQFGYFLWFRAILIIQLVAVG